MWFVVNDGQEALMGESYNKFVHFQKKHNKFCVSAMFALVLLPLQHLLAAAQKLAVKIKDSDRAIQTAKQFSRMDNSTII
jgi:hypothetical protein